jgi:HAD superfamily hydrolase (TIGR01458 family)
MPAMKALLFDLDGVLYEGDRPIAGAPEALAWVQAQGIPHLFVTNTTSRPRTALVEKLAGMDVAISPESVLSPAVVARAWLTAQRLGPVALFVPAATREEFASLPMLADDTDSGAGAVVVGDLGSGWDFATLNRAFRLLMAEPRPPLVGLGMTRYWQAADGLRLDTGTFVTALAHAADTEPVVLGKPAELFFTQAIERLGVTPAETVMIGDDIVGDVDGAQQAGLRGVLVRTGKYRSDDTIRTGVEPVAVLDSIADLPAWWQSCDAT